MDGISRVALRSGALTAELDNDLSLRDIRVGGLRALDALTLTTRDDQWGTAEVETLKVEISVDQHGFIVDFECRHRIADVEINWRGRYSAVNSELTAHVVGISARRQRVNRTGFVLRHPIELVGREVQTTSNGREQHGRFSRRISATPLFSGFDRMTYGLGGGARLAIEFDAPDLYETEDHRNWTDAGWKSYSPSTSLPQPQLREKGSREEHRLTLSARLPVGSTTRQDHPVHIEVGGRSGSSICELGSGVSFEPNYRRLGQLQNSLGLTFLAAEILSGDQAATTWSAAVNEAEAVGVPLSLSLAVPGDELDGWMRRIVQDVARGVAIPRIMVVSRDRGVADDSVVAQTRAILHDALGERAPEVGAGVLGYFAELNSASSNSPAADFLSFSVCPQVHHHDNEDILDTVAGMRYAIEDALDLAGDRPLHVGPITLRQRMIQHRIPLLPPPTTQRGSPDIDPRQHTKLAAIYAMGCLAASDGAASMQLFRLAGPRGISPIDAEDSPVERVIRTWTAAAGARRRRVHVSDPRRVVAVAWEMAGRGIMVAVANRSPHAVNVTVGAHELTLDALDWGVVESAGGTFE